MGGAWPTSGMASAPAAESPEHQRALAADHDEADARGNGDCESRQDQWRRALEGILEGECGAEPAAPHVSNEVGRRLADRQQKDGKQRRCDKKREQRDDDIFRIDAQPIDKVRPGRARRDRIDDGARRAGCDRRIGHRLVPFEPQVVEPTTPSSR